MTFAPIIAFVYNRLDHTKEMIEALRKNRFAAESELFIVSDGYKNDEDRIKVDSVRDYCKSISGFLKVHLIFRKKNYGLRNNIISGLNSIFKHYDRAIVLEDDIVTAPEFLNYMNFALDRYKEEEKVYSISGYTAPYDKEGLPDFFFTYWIECWGWGTWKDRWEKMNSNPRELIKETGKDLIRFININGTSPDMWDTVLLNYQKRKRTWAIFFHSMVCKENGLVLFPKKSLCKNIGFDGSGENCDISEDYRVNLEEKEVSEYDFPGECLVNESAVRSFEEFNRQRIAKWGMLGKCMIIFKTKLFYVLRRLI